MQADMQVVEECHVSKSGQDQGRLRVMSLHGVAQHPSPAGTPRGQHCTQTAITLKHRPLLFDRKS